MLKYVINIYAIVCYKLLITIILTQKVCFNFPLIFFNKVKMFWY